MEAWKRTWREGIAPLLETKALEALRDALASDDLRIVQGATTVPPPLMAVQDWPCAGACPVGFCGLAIGLGTVGEVEEFFARLAFEADCRLGEPGAIRWFTNRVDEMPRAEMRAALLPEVERELAIRGDRLQQGKVSA